jgi:hypothetical protein
MKHLATPSKGRIGLASKEHFLADIAQHEGHTIEITVKRNRNGRTTKQNAYYHTIVETIRQAMNEAGNDYDHDETHEILKKEFLSETAMVVNKNGEYLETNLVKSTTQLDTTEFNAYLEKVMRWAAEFFYISFPPLPL